MKDAVSFEEPAVAKACWGLQLGGGGLAEQSAQAVRNGWLDKMQITETLTSI